MECDSKIAPGGEKTGRLLILICTSRAIRLVEGASDLSFFYFYAEDHRSNLYDRFRVVPPTLQILFDPSLFSDRSEHFYFQRGNEYNAFSAFCVSRAHLCEQTSCIVAWCMRHCVIFWGCLLILL